MTAQKLKFNLNVITLLSGIFLLVFFVSFVAQAESNEQPAGFAEVVGKLTTNDYKEKESIIVELSRLGDERVLDVFATMLKGDLYYRKSDQTIVRIKSVEDGYQVFDVVTGEDLGVVGTRKVKKVSVNNKLRRMLSAEIAKLSLSSSRASVRLSAVNDLLSNLDESAVALLRTALIKEQDESVIEVIKEGIAIADINSDDKQVRLAAITVLADSLQPLAKGHLERLLTKDSEGNFTETDKEVRAAASKSLEKINSRREVYAFGETLIFGLSLGSVLLLAAIGLAITFGVMGVINMAHGEMIMLGAYTTYLIQMAFPGLIDYTVLISIPAAFIVSGSFGIAIERGVIRFLYGRPLETLLATFGISLILQQLVRTTISAQNVPVSTPEWMSGSWQINPIFSLTYNRLYIILFSLMVFFALLLILKRTTLGLKVRAVSQNRGMARAMGVRSEWVDAMTFGLGSGIAGIAGVALSQLTNVGPNLGQSYIIDSFMVVVFGGVGNLWGTLVGAMGLGVLNKFLEPSTGAVMAKILVLVLIIMFIQKRPRGLFPQKGRAAEN